MNYLFTSESVSEGHPDKVADQISDTLLDEFLARDPQSHVAVETLCTTGQVVVAGEVSSRAYVDIQNSIRCLINAASSAQFTSRVRISTVVSAVRKKMPRRKTCKVPVTRV